MATPADQRLLELLDKWLDSLELHAKYSSLDDDSYWKIQPWVEHQRPSRWIIDLAIQKTIALRAHVQERAQMGDAKYSDSLELMIFLANLVGSEHIERFIPVADAQNERSLTPQPPSDAHRTSSDTVTVTAAVTATATREMPKFVATRRTPPPAGTAQVARTERKAPAPAKPVARPANKPAARPGTAAKAAAPQKPAPTATGPRMPRARKSSQTRHVWCNGDVNGTNCRSSSRAWRAGPRCPRCGAYSRKINRPSNRKPGARSRLTASARSPRTCTRMHRARKKI